VVRHPCVGTPLLPCHHSMPVAKRAVQAVWGRTHPFVQAVCKLNPHRSPLDCESHAMQLLRRRRVVKVMDMVDDQDLDEEERRGMQRVDWGRQALLGEQVEEHGLAESVSPKHMKEEWGAITNGTELLTEDQLNTLKADKMISLIQAQFPNLNYLDASELWAKVSSTLSKKDGPKPRSQIHSDLTLNVTRRNIDDSTDDDITFDFAQLLARVDKHWIVRTNEAMNSGLAQGGWLDQKKLLQNVLVKLWKLPEHEIRYVADPYRLYHHLLEDYLTEEGRKQSQPKDAADRQPAVRDGHVAVDNAQAGAGPEAPVQVAYCPGSRKRAKAAVKLLPSISARDQFLDIVKGVSGLDLMYRPSLEALPRPNAEDQLGGQVVVNYKPIVDYFKQPRHLEQILLPFDVAGLDYRQWYVEVKTYGGNLGSQAEAVRLGLARCIAELLPECRERLEQGELLRRDLREVLPKLSGRTKHRKGHQWRKR